MAKIFGKEVDLTSIFLAAAAVSATAGIAYKGPDVINGASKAYDDYQAMTHYPSRPVDLRAK